MVDPNNQTPPPNATTSPKPADAGDTPNLPQSQGQQEDISDVLEERLIDAEYKIWKKNTPYLYDLVMTHSLEWPSLTCQWLPTVKSSKTSSTEEHSLLLGTHTASGEMNYLIIANITLPKSSTLIPKDAPPSPPSKPSDTTKPLSDYDDERNEIGGFGYTPPSNSTGRTETKMKIPHKGEVNRARYMPQNHFMIASRGPDPDCYIWDLTKHSSVDVGAATGNPVPERFCPQLVLRGHSKEGYGMTWSPHTSGMLVTSSEDTTICLWDINARPSVLNEVSPKGVAKGHTAVVEDVAFHHFDQNLFGSVGDDNMIGLWDVRNIGGSNQAMVHVVKDAHQGDINSIAFNPVTEFLFATASADKTVALWDVRNLKSKVQSFVGHNDQVYQVEWAPFNETVLASCSADRRVNIWDLSRIGEEQTPEDAEDGPPELLFMHGGHTSRVSDFSWNPNMDWTLASVSEDNVMQVWNMAEEIYAGDSEDEEDAEEEMKEDDLE